MFSFQAECISTSIHMCWHKLTSNHSVEIQRLVRYISITEIHCATTRLWRSYQALLFQRLKSLFFLLLLILLRFANNIYLIAYRMQQQEESYIEAQERFVCIRYVCVLYVYLRTLYNAVLRLHLRSFFRSFFSPFFSFWLTDWQKIALAATTLLRELNLLARLSFVSLSLARPL